MSKLNDAPTAYTFDDLTLVPQHSLIKSRRDPDISINIPGFSYKIPIVSSPMNTVTEADMLVTMVRLGGTGVLHRYMSTKSQVKVLREVYNRITEQGLHLDMDSDKNPPYYVAVGANGDFLERVEVLQGEFGVNGFCVDVANGHNELSVEAVRAIREQVPDARIMAGNVCTYEGAYALAEAGADSIRVGIGPGAVCTTRQVTGHGVPQLSAIEDCARIKGDGSFHYFDPGGKRPTYPEVAIIADGGIRKSGDIVKALAIGADAVMIGSLLAGTIETPGEWLEEDGVLYKYYHGMASDEGRRKWMGKPKIGVPAEGVSKKIIYSGRSAEKIVDSLCASVKVGLSFSNASNVNELRHNAQWVRVSGAGYTEGTPHGK